MNREIIIRVKNVSKKFKIYHDKPITLKEKLLSFGRNTHDSFIALKDINIDIAAGESFGLIGENGSGKSTLLKMITRIIYPDSGNIEVKGRVSSLLELGAGFHPDFTGRENIYTNAAIFGISKKEVDKRINDIIAFSELGEFIDNPVRIYSSGMYMRLAFSVAINVDPDVLLIDEILAVGDTNFQRKCFEWLGELKRRGVTIVIVTHDTNTVQRLCDKAVWLNNGEIACMGETNKVVNEYLHYMSDKYVETNKEDGAVKPDQIQETPEDGINSNTEGIKSEEDVPLKRYGDRKVELFNIRMSDETGRPVTGINTGQPIIISYDYRINTPVDSVIFGITIRRIDGLHCYGVNTLLDEYDIKELAGKLKTGVVKIKIDNFNFLENTYLIDVAVTSKLYNDYDYHYDALKLIVNNSMREVGICTLPHEWEIE